MAGTCAVTITVTPGVPPPPTKCPSDPIGFILCTFFKVPLLEGWWLKPPTLPPTFPPIGA